ncbi:hypothetical protein [Polyangium mundeleinium]|uniref:Carboxypeptidase regulatory-like domain-containing protein n=1 Tax=Polyangium mundeleinium TaxID=2995306 RepID=A0ABT5F7W8_9BACT|nr:hypothetical protein [Polyangium mundeleinium]MDC0749200.1 hypothetical protein [Polyangium mundeleinium]
MMTAKTALASSLVVLGMLVGCGNRAVDERIAALGEEDPNVPVGEFHRPGQPCVLCHGEYLRENPVMSVGGTIYAYPTQTPEQKPLPVKGVKVKLTDSFGEQYEVGTNCAGNFFIETDKWDPAFPLRAEIEYPVPGALESTKRVVMSTRISRDGSCAGCHVGNPNQGSPGWVTCAAAETNPPFPPQDPACPGAAK